MADKKRMKRRKPGQRSDLFEMAKQPKPSKWDNLGMSLRCVECERIWAGPHKGETVKRFSTESKAIEAEAKRNGYLQGGISDGVCNKRSCQEANNHRLVSELQGMYDDRDPTFFADMEQRMNRESYEIVRNDKEERYPGGLIDDVEPPL